LTEPKRRIRLPRTLDAKMLYMILLSFACAALLYLIVYGLGTLALNRIYMSPESVASRQAKIYSDFSKYVTAHNIAGSDEAAVAHWSGNDAYTTILIYKDTDLNGRIGDGRAQSSVNFSKRVRQALPHALCRRRLPHRHRRQ